MDNLRIADNFSRYAHLYDKYADVQREAASALADSIENGNFRNILEIGCGTGNYTLMLRDRFKSAQIKALDISKKMISVAKDKLKNKEVELLVADGKNISFNQDFDLITSNACFQWFDDLGEVLRGYVKLLRKEGAIHFSIFGPHTFEELNTALMHIFKDERINSAYFCDRNNLEAILKDNFKSVKVNEIYHKETYADLKGLLEKIKYSGIRGNGLSKKIHFSRAILEKLEKVYLDRFQEVRATYQVLLCSGEKR